MAIKSDDLEGLNSNDWRVIKPALEGLLDTLRTPSNRELIPADAIHRIAQLFLQTEEDSVKVLVIRTIANAVADSDKNRETLLEDQEFLAGVTRLLSRAADDDVVFANVALTLLFNFGNDNEAGSKHILDDANLPNAIAKAIIAFHSDEKFLFEVALSLVELYVQQNKTEDFSETLVDELLEVGVSLLEEDGEQQGTEDERARTRATLEQPVTILMRLIESNEKFEKAFSSDRNKFLTLLKIGKASIDLDQAGQHALAVVGNISSRPEFSDLVQISNDDNIYSFVQDIVSYDTTNLMLVSSACLILGNLAVNAESVAKIMELKPDLIDIVMWSYKDCTNPFQLQGAHLIKNISAHPDFKSAVLNAGAINMVRRLCNIKLFPSIRRLGVQLARNLLTDAEAPDLDLLDVVLETFRTDDSEVVKQDCLQAQVVVVETLVKHQNLEYANERLENIILTLENGMVNVIEAPVERWNYIILIKVSKALGLLSAENEGQILLLKDMEVTKKLFDQSDKVKEQVANQGQLLGVVKNLGFIASQLLKRGDIEEGDDFKEASQKAIINASEDM